jgi:hypothetical protein
VDPEELECAADANGAARIPAANHRKSGLDPSTVRAITTTGGGVMKLKLGKLPSTSVVKMTIALPAVLKAQLDRYARLHSQTWEQQVDTATLIPHIVAQFLANDRAFQKLERVDRSNSNNHVVDE